MTEIRVRSSGTKKWAIFFPVAYPIQLTDRCSKEAWAAFIKELNELGTASVDYADEHYPWWTKGSRGAVLSIIAILCFVSVVCMPLSVLLCIYVCCIEAKEKRIIATGRTKYNDDFDAVISKWNKSEPFTRGVISVKWACDTQIYTTVSGYQGSVSSQVNREHTWFLVVSLGPLPVAEPAATTTGKQVTVKFGGATQIVTVDQRMTGADLLAALPMLFGDDENMKAGAPRSLTLVGKGIVLPSTSISDVLGSNGSGVIEIK
jgi:hypothetical protein